jgi:hypothetical protein
VRDCGSRAARQRRPRLLVFTKSYKNCITGYLEPIT